MLFLVGSKGTHGRNGWVSQGWCIHICCVFDKIMMCVGWCYKCQWWLVWVELGCWCCCPLSKHTIICLCNISILTIQFHHCIPLCSHVNGMECNNQHKSLFIQWVDCWQWWVRCVRLWLKGEVWRGPVVWCQLCGASCGEGWSIWLGEVLWTLQGRCCLGWCIWLVERECSRINECCVS